MASFAGFNSGQCIFKNYYAQRLNAEAARDLEKQGRIRLARKLERLGINPIHAGIEMIVQSCGVQYRGGVFARRAHSRFDACPSKSLEKRSSTRCWINSLFQCLQKQSRFSLAECMHSIRVLEITL